MTLIYHLAAKPNTPEARFGRPICGTLGGTIVAKKLTRRQEQKAGIRLCKRCETKKTD